MAPQINKWHLASTLWLIPIRWHRRPLTECRRPLQRGHDSGSRRKGWHRRQLKEERGSRLLYAVFPSLQFACCVVGWFKLSSCGLAVSGVAWKRRLLLPEGQQCYRGGEQTDSWAGGGPMWGCSASVQCEASSKPPIPPRHTVNPWPAILSTYISLFLFLFLSSLSHFQAVQYLSACLAFMKFYNYTT